MGENAVKDEDINPERHHVTQETRGPAQEDSRRKGRDKGSAWDGKVIHVNGSRREDSEMEVHRVGDEINEYLMSAFG